MRQMTVRSERRQCLRPARERRWKTRGATHIGNRGVGISGNWLYFETPDCMLVSLNLKDGKERWRKTICDLDQFFFGSTSPSE